MIAKPRTPPTTARADRVAVTRANGVPLSDRTKP